MQFFDSRRWAEFDICIQFLGEIPVDLIDGINCSFWQKIMDLLENVFVVRISAVSNNPTIGFLDALRFKPSSFPKLIDKSVDLGIIDLLLVRKGHRQNNLRHIELFLFENRLEIDLVPCKIGHDSEIR